jgi:SagB-type dehydrogenase family enzyme
MSMIDVFRMMGEGRSVPELVAAYAAAKAEEENERRARFAAFGAPPECLWPASWVFHEQSRITPTWWPLLTSEEAEAFTTQLDYKRYPNAPRVALPPAPPVDARLEDTLLGRRSVREFADAPLTMTELSQLLSLSCGVVEPDGHVPRRVQPSGGGLYPVETYVVARAVESLPPALYHFAPLENALELVRSLPPQDVLRKCVPEVLADSRPPVIFVMTLVYARTQTKYMERGYRFGLLEAGHIAQSICLLAVGLGLSSVCMGGFYDDDLNQLLELDTRKETCIYGVLAGRARVRPPEGPNASVQ